MDSLGRRFRVLSKHYDFLVELEAETKEIQRNAIISFNEAFQSWKEAYPHLWNELPVQAQQNIEPPELESILEPKLVDDQLVALYKDIAKKTHPDVNLDKEELFLDAQEALDYNDWSKMLKVANELDLKTPEVTFGMLGKLETSVKKIESEINGIRATVIWVWFHEKRASIKNQIFGNFILHLKGQHG